MNFVCKEVRKNEWIVKYLRASEQVPIKFVEDDANLHAAIRVGKAGTMIFADETYFYVINMMRDDVPPVKFK